MYQEPIHTFDFSNVEVFEAGAGLLTLLAYPGPDCEQKRADLHATLCALAVRVAYPLDSEHALRPHLMKPIYCVPHGAGDRERCPDAAPPSP